MEITKKLSGLGLSLPKPSKALGAYVPCLISGNLLFLSGIIPAKDGKPLTGKFGKDLSLEDAKEIGRIVVLTMLANIQESIGNLDKIKRVVKIEGFINSTPDFTDQPKVLNEVSNLLVEIFGEAGKHSRIAIGVNALPLGASLEVSGIVEIEKEPHDKD